SQPLGLGLVQARTPLGSMLIVLGPFLVVALALGLWGLLSGGVIMGVRALGERLGRPAALVLGLLAAALLLLEAGGGEWTLLLLTALLLLLLPLGLTLAAADVNRRSSPLNLPLSAANLGPRASSLE